MKKLHKKGAALTLALALLTALLAACSGGNNAKSGNEGGGSASSPAASASEEWQKTAPGSGGQALPVTQQLKEYTFMARELGGVPFKDSFVVLPELERRTNVKLNLIKVPESNYGDKLNVVMASGELPDLIAGVNINVANEFGPKGLFLNLWDYIDIMPNMKKAFETYPEFNDYKYSDTELYQVLNQCAPDSDPQGFGFYKQIPMIRTDVLKTLNLEAPKTFDELRDTLVRIKEAYPDSRPWISDGRGFEFLQQVLAGWNGKILEPNYYYSAFDPEAGQWGFAPEQEGFKELVEYMHGLYADGLLDNEFFLTNNSQSTERAVNDKGFFYYSYWNNSATMTLRGQENGNPNFLMSGILPIVKDGPSAAVVRNACSNFSAVNAKVSDPEPLLKALDYWLYSQDGTMLANAGIEGVNFVWEEDQKIYKLVDPKLEKPDNETHKAEFGVRYDFMTGLRPDHFDIHNKLEDPDNDMYHQQFLLYKDHAISPGPVKIFKDPEDSNTMSEIGVPIRDYVEQQFIKFVMGAANMSTWDQFIETCKKMGSDKMIELLNK
ncbi:extracellular solute-binding protein [Cohnella cellulosilytica]|uniref:Extracellular solute-binding protein n=1 Tax=Cohnella cellulosilytica TaxID=986710 RepID=A0ABW2FDL1_9BACL